MRDEQFELHARIEMEHWWFVARRQIVTTMLEEMIGDDREMIVTEVGMGTGGNIGSLMRKYQCVGIEVSEKAVELARKQYPKLEIHHGDALTEHAKFVRTANAVLLLDVLEHIEDDVAFLKKLGEIMPSNCVLIATVPADKDLWSPHDEHHGHFRRYDPKMFRAAVAKSPLKLRFLSHYNARLYPIVKFIRKRNRKSGDTAGEAGTDLKMPSNFANKMLTRIFAGERGPLRRALEQGGDAPYSKGVSLIAVMRKP